MVTQAHALVHDLHVFDDPDSAEFDAAFSFPRFEQYIPSCAATVSDARFDEELKEIIVLMEEQAALPEPARTAPAVLASGRIAVERSSSMPSDPASATTEAMTVALDLHKPRRARRVLTRLFIFAGLGTLLVAIPSEDALHALWRVQELVSQLVAMVG
jgi:hypothetical protein